jgi:hypothetical protein
VIVNKYTITLFEYKQGENVYLYMGKRVLIYGKTCTYIWENVYLLSLKPLYSKACGGRKNIKNIKNIKNRNFL